MKKKWISILLCVVMMCNLLPGMALAEDVAGDIESGRGIYGGIEWTFEVTKVIDGKSYGKLTIAPAPEDVELAKNPVTQQPYERGYWAERVLYDDAGNVLGYGTLPYNTTRVIDLEIKEGVVFIGAFVAENMPFAGELVIPSTVRQIGQEAFHGGRSSQYDAPRINALTFATRLENGEQVSDLKCIAPGAFKYLHITEVEIPEGVQCIHTWAFQDCRKLESVTIPSTVIDMDGHEHWGYAGQYYMLKEGDDDYEWDTRHPKYSSDIFKSNAGKALETVIFGSEEVRDQFISIVNYVNVYSGLTSYVDLQTAINTAKEANGEVVFAKNFSVLQGATIEIPENITLVIPSGTTLTINGKLVNLGQIVGGGSVVNNGTYAASAEANVGNNITFSGDGTSTTASLISYELNGGTASNQSYYVWGESATLQDPTRNGYIFEGWSGSGLNDNDDNKSITVPLTSTTSNLSFEAHWNPISYTVVFHANNGSETTSSQLFYYDGGERLTNTFENGDKVFDKWNTAADGSGTSYGQVAVNLTVVDGAEVHLYAQWKDKQSTPTYDYVYIPPSYDVVIASDIENGSVTLSENNAYEGETVTITVTPDAGYKLRSLLITDRYGNKVEVVKVNETTYTFKMPSSNIQVDAEMEKAYVTCPGGEACVMHSYTDVTQDDWFYDGVHFCIENGLMTGTAKNAFAPNMTTNRAMLVSILWRMEENPVVNYLMQFDDVTSGQWYTEAIRWAASEGIVGGYGDGSFGTTDTLTREQLVAIMWNYAQYKGYDVSVKEDTNILSYADLSDVSAWALPAMQWASDYGLIQGIADGDKRNLAPKDSVTRAQAAVILQRYCEEIMP